MSIDYYASLFSCPDLPDNYQLGGLNKDLAARGPRLDALCTGAEEARLILSKNGHHRILELNVSLLAQRGGELFELIGIKFGPTLEAEAPFQPLIVSMKFSFKLP